MGEEKHIDGMVIRPTSTYADGEPELDPPTEEDLAARKRWADRHVVVASATLASGGEASDGAFLDLDDTPPSPSVFCDACYDQQQGFGKCRTHDAHVAVSPSPYQNPLAALRRERKVKHGKAAALLGISRQRLHVVEHATKPLPCMQRLVDKAMLVWPVSDETKQAPDEADYARK